MRPWSQLHGCTCTVATTHLFVRMLQQRGHSPDVQQCMHGIIRGCAVQMTDCNTCMTARASPTLDSLLRHGPTVPYSRIHTICTVVPGTFAVKCTIRSGVLALQGHLCTTCALHAIGTCIVQAASSTTPPISHSCCNRRHVAAPRLCRQSSPPRPRTLLLHWC